MVGMRSKGRVLWLVSALFLPAVARADVPPDEGRPPDPCARKQKGDECGPAKVCVDSTCCRRKHVSATLQHYESRKPNPDPDILDPPEVCSPCLACEGSGAAVKPETPAAPAVSPTPTPAATPTPAGAWGELLLGALLLVGVARGRRRR
jgi:hypothetical protein